MSTMASQITSLMIVYTTIYSRADQRKHQNSASLAFVLGTNRLPVNSLYKGPVTRKMFPFDDVIMSDILSKQNKSRECTQSPDNTTYLSINPMIYPHIGDLHLMCDMSIFGFQFELLFSKA